MLDMYYDLIAGGDLALRAVKGEKLQKRNFQELRILIQVTLWLRMEKPCKQGTSHYLGQTFSDAFNIKFSGKDNKEHLAYTASWGITTRLIGAIIVSHADDNGLVLPPQTSRNPYCFWPNSKKINITLLFFLIASIVVRIIAVIIYLLWK